ncbi:MAG: hypothetical protein ACR2QH_02805, partial [Geminicoccaceae bacterium]
MKAAALFAGVAALAILAGAYSTARHHTEREAWRLESKRLSTEIADLERRVEIQSKRRSSQQPYNGSERVLVDATEQLSAIEAEILKNRADLVQLKSDRLVADEYAKSSFEKLRQQVRKTTEIEQDLVELHARRLRIRNRIASAKEKVEALTATIADRQDYAASLDRRIAELAIREETARARLAIAKEAETSIASTDAPNEVSVKKSAPVKVAEAPAPKAEASIDRAALSDQDQDRSKGLYRFKSLTVDQGLGGPVSLSKNEAKADDDSAADEQAASDAWALKQYELGRILIARSENHSGTRELNEAVLAFKAVLNEWPKDRNPERWAATQSDLGYALTLLGKRHGSVGTLESAAIACRNALAEIKQDRTPLLWATAQYNLGLTLSGIAEIKNDEELWKNAIEALQQSVETFEEEGAGAEEA